MIRNESQFFQQIKLLTASNIFWERIEPKTEGGFPDTHFVLRNGILSREGTVEFKFKSNLSCLPSSGRSRQMRELLKPSQKVNVINYFQKGGYRRWYLFGCSSKQDTMYGVTLLTTEEMYFVVTDENYIVERETQWFHYGKQHSDSEYIIDRFLNDA